MIELTFINPKYGSKIINSIYYFAKVCTRQEYQKRSITMKLGEIIVPHKRHFRLKGFKKFFKIPIFAKKNVNKFCIQLFVK